MSDSSDNSKASSVFLFEDRENEDHTADKETSSFDSLCLEAGDIKEISLDLSGLEGPKKESRGAVRVPYFGKVLLHECEKQRSFKGKVKDLSAAGLGLEIASNEIKIGQKFDVEFVGTPSMSPFFITCEVVRLSHFEGREGDKQHYVMGLRIVKATKSSAEKIRNYIESCKTDTGFFSDEVK